MRILTIGGYGFTEGSFLRTLQDARVDTFVDVRQRRGMRGAKYAFLNSARLQQLLGSIGVRYVHALELAPTTSVRDAQKHDDLEAGTTKRDRTQLSPAFVRKYDSEILAKFDDGRLRALLNGANVVALFCVEGNPAACHRSLAADHLAHVFESDRPVVHLEP
jgi:uncharacterized protein (DUF488 family)